MNSTLQEALAEPLVDGPLEPLPRSAARRSLPQDLPTPAATELPMASIGRPRAWPLPDLLRGDEISPDIKASLAEETFFVLRLACSFRPRGDKVGVSWAQLVVELEADGQGRQPYAFDLYPREVQRERQVSKKVSLSPSLKYLEVEASLGGLEYTVEYPAVEPVLSAAGLLESVPSWNFDSLPEFPIHGGKLLHMVIAAPRDLDRLALTVRLTADLEYHGFRLPAWLRDDPTRIRPKPIQITVWP
jgi:hypothetical protein